MRPLVAVSPLARGVGRFAATLGGSLLHRSPLLARYRDGGTAGLLTRPPVEYWPGGGRAAQVAPEPVLTGDRDLDRLLAARAARAATAPAAARRSVTAASVGRGLPSTLHRRSMTAAGEATAAGSVGRRAAPAPLRVVPNAAYDGGANKPVTFTAPFSPPSGGRPRAPRPRPSGSPAAGGGRGDRSDGERPAGRSRVPAGGGSSGSGGAPAAGTPAFAPGLAASRGGRAPQVIRLARRAADGRLPGRVTPPAPHPTAPADPTTIPTGVSRAPGDGVPAV
ncbi:MAG: hypothetical protein AB7W59_31145, partial [Acidimicrobiia bacterium]